MSDLIHLQPALTVLAGPFKPDWRCEIVSLTHTLDGLKIRVESGDMTAEVNFATTWGYRVMDELDLTEFWSQCSMKTGWFFEVTSGGWKAFEQHRAHYVSGHLYEDMREFLLLSMNFCVSVLSTDEPEIHTQAMAPLSHPQPPIAPD